jgi:hypothetical protein
MSGGRDDLTFPCVTQHVVQTAVSRSGNVPSRQEGEVHWIDRLSQPGIYVRWRIFEEACARLNGLVSANSYPFAVIRTLQRMIGEIVIDRTL